MICHFESNTPDAGNLATTSKITNKTSPRHQSMVTLGKSIFASLILLALPETSAYALSATTAKTIQGTAPFLSFDGGATKATNMDSLLTIQLSDGTSYTPSTNTSTITNPILLPVAGQSLSDITTFIPANQSAILLDDLIKPPYNFFYDSDGDDVPKMTPATSALSLVFKDNAGNLVSPTEKITSCSGPYQLTITTNAAQLTTDHGDPRQTNYAAGSATYFIAENGATPQACFARPNLKYGDNTGVAPNGIAGYNFAGPANQWDPKKGFIPQSLTNPSANFPTTAASGLSFVLSVANVIDSNIYIEKSPASSNINLIRSAGASAYEPKFTFTGGATTNTVNTTFNIYADSSKADLIYTFQIPKKGWFWQQAVGNATGSWDSFLLYSANCTAGRNAMPWELSNSPFAQSVPPRTWLNTYNADVVYEPLATQWHTTLDKTNAFKRQIGGGLYAEWGSSASAIAQYFGSHLGLLNSTWQTVMGTASYNAYMAKQPAVVAAVMGEWGYINVNVLQWTSATGYVQTGGQRKIWCANP